MDPEIDLNAALRRWWGYDSFLPLQERIVRSIIGGSDVAAVLPTGGGKSLCYQLPAVALGRTAVIISPLIALMQDQAAQLEQMGIPAAVVNSTMPSDQQREVMRASVQGAYRLLYLSPERLARADTIGWLRRVPVSFFAIDEAHCISEWGHEFRPEYRQLSCLRDNFPDLPIAAFTASATKRVRQDILDQLRLHEPHKYIRSFLRPNLRYYSAECDSRKQRSMMLAALRAWSGESVIIYAPTIAGVEETVDYLAERDIAAIAYHGKMDAAERQRNQERWTSDEVRVLVGTIAFGLGINKPGVRAVIHLSLPKSVEQYYQESGRAGRDGQPSDCVLLWGKRDIFLLRYFIDQLQDENEKQRALWRMKDMIRLAESRHCRKHQICLHFGEKPKWERCEVCDACGWTPDWVKDAEAQAEKRTRKRKSKTPVPAAAAPAPKTAAAKSAGAAPPRAAAAAPPREPLPPEPPATRPTAPPPSRTATPGIDPGLLEHLRAWRRETAQRAGVPAYVVLHDSSLEDLCRRRPRSLADLLRVTGIGEARAARWGAEIFSTMDAYERGEHAVIQAGVVSKPAEETIELLNAGRTFEEIAHIRGRQLSTVVNLVADLIERGRLEPRPEWVRPASRKAIEDAAGRAGFNLLKPIQAAVGDDIPFAEIRIVVAELRRKAGQAEPDRS